MTGLIKTAGALLAFFLVAAAFLAFKPTESKQIGFNGVGMENTDSDERIADRLKANKLPPVQPLTKSGDLAVDAYQNVQVLGHLTTSEFIGMMNAMTAWVSPPQGCGYCHVDGHLATAAIYTKVVSRRMLQMTQYINENLQSHVKETGVTCYTCHRGQPVPRYIWFEHEVPEATLTMLGNNAQQNRANRDNYSSLPHTAFEEFLLGDTNVRVQTPAPLPGENHSSIKQTEWTYSLMMHFSRSLGVSCSHCHNSRAWEQWEESPAPREVAWHGIRMVRHLNSEWLEPLAGVFPPERQGPTGDAPKLNCATCHQGAYKPLLGQSMLPDYPP
ncbi:MAG: photosynthetic reaction center cytochrome c subunit, partial [Deltaproteobacteria bacterium]|nr:photosynthetic reaction center cytochrome c subunit [Nannocystaceae bacterium]